MTTTQEQTPTRRELVAGFVPRSPLVRTLGIRLDRLEPDVAELVLPFAEQNVTIGDVVHGGAIAALIDTAGMTAAWADDGTRPDAMAGATVSMSVYYVAAARRGDVVAKGLVTHRFG
jgi:uncharacterized protein (TIGR00369 family)